jgi:pimeloyl-ACP methyl ester carboxylesterase
MASVVLVHGAFAEGSSWSKVIPLLLAKGNRVTSVAIPLTSFAEDVAATKRAIGAQEGPVLLAGHSYGGVVITEAGNDAKVTGLVYVAAFAPDAGQSIGDVSKGFPQPCMIAPEQEQTMAKTIGAKTVSVPSSHCAMLSHPTEVADVIDEAAHTLAAR